MPVVEIFPVIVNITDRLGTTVNLSENMHATPVCTMFSMLLILVTNKILTPKSLLHYFFKQ